MDTVILKEVLNYHHMNPYPNTHCVIGSAARTTNLTKYLPQMQQILPPFLDLSTQTRLIHIDPNFENQIEFLHEYFNSKNIGFTYDDSEGMHIWRSTDNVIEIIIICISFYYSTSSQTLFNETSPNSEWFFEGLINTALLTNSKLIVQDYSGHDTHFIFKKLYESSPNKQAYRNNILFDFSYGHNNCDLDLIKYHPLYDQGNFINIMLMSVDELMVHLHNHPFIDEHINNYYVIAYRSIIDIIPVDYRRKMKIEAGDQSLGLICYKNLYDINTSYDEIISIFCRELEPIITVFRKIGYMNSEKEVLLKELLSGYRNYTLVTKPDIYHWSNQFIKIIT